MPDQLAEDRKLLKRIDEYGVGLSTDEITYLESFMRRVEGGIPLTEKQRRVAQDIDERRVR